MPASCCESIFESEGSNPSIDGRIQKGALAGALFVFVAEREGWALRLRLRARDCAVGAARVELASHPMLARPENEKGPDGPLFIFWRRERDSNPRYAINVYSLSRGALSTTQPSLRNFFLLARRFRASQRGSKFYSTQSSTCRRPSRCPDSSGERVDSGLRPSPLRGALRFAACVQDRLRRSCRPLSHLSEILVAASATHSQVPNVLVDSVGQRFADGEWY